MRAAIFPLLLVLLAGCGGAAVAPPTPLPGQSAADAQATLTAWQLAINATATTAAQQAQATVAAVEAERATVAAATAAAVSTRDALTIQTTAVALQMSIDSATSTAVAAAAQATTAAGVQQTADAAEMAAVAIVQQDTAIRLEQERRAEETWLRWQPVLYGVAVAAIGLFGLACLALLGYILWRQQFALRHPIVEVSDRVWLARTSDGRGLLSSPRLVTIPAASAPRALPAPAAEKLLPAGDFLPPQVALPAVNGEHVLVLGETGTGKSGVLRELIKQRQGRIVVADSHYRPGGWPSNVAEVVGAGGRYDAVADLFGWLGEELERRKARWATNDVDFEPLTVAMDEQPGLVARVDVTAMRAWQDVVREGAKYSLWVILGTQSLLVKDMGLEGRSSTLANFRYAVFLGSYAIREVPALGSLAERAAVVVRGGRPPVPVVVPYYPHEDPRSPHFRVPGVLPPVNAGLYRGPRQASANVVEGEIVTVTPAARDPRLHGLETRGGFVAPSEVSRILEMADRGAAHVAIEREVMQGEGGAFYYQVEDVLRHFRRSRSRAARSSGEWYASTTSTDSTAPTA